MNGIPILSMILQQNTSQIVYGKQHTIRIVYINRYKKLVIYCCVTDKFANYV